MFDLNMSYETMFGMPVPKDTSVLIEVSEVQGRNISKQVRANFYAYLRDYLKEESAEAAYALGLFYRCRRPCGDWFRRTLEYWTFAAAKNDVRAAWFLYELFHYGELGEVEPDPEQAFKWLLRFYELMPSAETGNMIARRYLMGEGTERNPEKAKEYYIKGVMQNDERSKRELDVLLQALRDKKADAESEQVELYCLKQLLIRHGAKFRED